MQALKQKIEAVLFVAGEPLGIEKLSKILKSDREKVEKALDEFSRDLETRGIRLLEKDGKYSLATAPEASQEVEEFLHEELGEELSRVALETLSIIVYKGPIARAEIDYIRGVNSAFTLRNLLVRGVVERESNPKDARSFLYTPSFDFLKYMGIKKLEKLPGFEEFRKELDEFLAPVEKI